MTKGDEQGAAYARVHVNVIQKPGSSFTRNGTLLLSIMASVDVPFLLRVVLHQIFNERDASKRRAAIAKYMSVTCLFIDPQAAHQGHAAIDDACVAVLKDTDGFVFTERGAPEVLHQLGDTHVGKLKWGFGPLGEPPKVLGEDVLTIEDGKIARLYTFLETAP